MMTFKNAYILICIFTVLIITVLLLLFLRSLSSGCGEIKRILNDDSNVERLSSCSEEYFSSKEADGFEPEINTDCFQFLDFYDSPNFIVDKVSVGGEVVMIGLGLGYRDQIIILKDKSVENYLEKMSGDFHSVSGNIFYSCES